MNAYLMTGQKSIPLQSLPPEAWRTIVGDTGAQGGAAERYADVAYLYRAIQSRCAAISDLPYAWHYGDAEEELEHEPTLPFDLNLRKLLYQIELHLLLFGAAYVLPEKNPFGVVKELVTLYPPTVQPQFDPDNGLTGFTRNAGTRTVTFAPDELVYIWLPPHAAEVGHGVGEAQVALRAAGILANIDEFARRFFAQGAINPTVISVPQGTLDADKERLTAWYKRMWSGMKNAFSVTAITGDLKVNQIGYPVNQLATPELTTRAREDIATALGIPQSFMTSSAANYATARQDDLNFYGKTVIPRAEIIAEALNKQLFGAWSLTLCWHPERLESYQAQETEKAQSLVSLVQAGIITVNEARERLELSPIEEEQAEETVDMREESDTNYTEPATPEEDVIEDETEMMNEIRRWQSVIFNRYKEGKPHKALAFKSDIIPSPLLAATIAQLEDASGVSEAMAIVGGLMNWSADYP